MPYNLLARLSAHVGYMKVIIKCLFSAGYLAIKQSKLEVISKDILIFPYFNLPFYKIVI